MNPEKPIKQYGLIIPKQQKPNVIQRRTIFEEEDDLEDDEPEIQMPQRKGPSLVPSTSKINNLHKAEIKKALEEDPNVYAYDDVYDDMKQPTTKSTTETKNVKPKYMENLLKSAELRKREVEAREERKIQKEREEEGDEFADKEAFVTSAYKEKLKQLKETEEREKREAAYENVLDVRNQKDLSGFYRHFLNQQVGETKVSDSSCSDRFSFPAKSVKNRNIRQRTNDDSDDEVLDKDNQPEIVPESVPVKPLEVDEKICNKESDEKSQLSEPEKKQEVEVAQDAEEPEIVKVDRRTLILQTFQKRTVGVIFDEAVARYKERRDSKS